MTLASGGMVSPLSSAIWSLTGETSKPTTVTLRSGPSFTGIAWMTAESARMNCLMFRADDPAFKTVSGHIPIANIQQMTIDGKGYAR